MVVSGGLTKAEKRRKGKGKGEKKRYIHLNPEFQRIARRDKKAFLSDQCQEIEENNRMRKTNTGEGVEKREPSYTVGGNAN